MKCTPLHVVALASAVFLSASTQTCVFADQSVPSPSVSSSERGAQNSAQSPSCIPVETSVPRGNSAANSAVKPAAPQNTNTVPSRHQTRGQYLARTALSYRGAPYRFGGRSARSGFDCSGLVQSVYAKWGLYLPRAAHAQFHMGTPVKPKDLQAGDLVFFKNTYKRGISHVGIYIGAGRFIHASRPGIGVVLSRLDEGYHKKRWAGARRLNLSKLPAIAGEEKPVSKVVVEEEAASPPLSPETPSESVR